MSVEVLFLKSCLFIYLFGLFWVFVAAWVSVVVASGVILVAMYGFLGAVASLTVERGH